MTEVEMAVANIWGEVLQRDAAVAIDDNFFDSGGDSLTMMMMLFRVKEEFGADLTPSALIDAPTLREFCRMVESFQGAQNGLEGLLGTVAPVKSPVESA